MVIEYFVKPNDDSVVYQLTELGFNIRNRLTPDNLAHFKTNALYYGDAVSIQDIKSISFVLTLGGLPLQTIKPSQYHDSWKANVIDIAIDTSALSNPYLRLQEIFDFEKP